MGWGCSGELPCQNLLHGFACCLSTAWVPWGVLIDAADFVRQPAWPAVGLRGPLISFGASCTSSVRGCRGLLEVTFRRQKVPRRASQYMEAQALKGLRPRLRGGARALRGLRGIMGPRVSSSFAPEQTRRMGSLRVLARGQRAAPRSTQGHRGEQSRTAEWPAESQVQMHDPHTPLQGQARYAPPRRRGVSISQSAALSTPDR